MPKKLTKNDFIQRSMLVHKNLYDYSLVDYTTTSSYVTIICKNHGKFIQRASNHLSGIGCKKCSFEKTKVGIDNFIKRSNTIHNNKYDYSKSIYTRSNSKIKIICKEHGEFYQSARAHMDGHGCQKCVGLFGDKESFLKKAKKSHGDTYDYSNVEYKNSYTEVEIICKIHGSFFQKPSIHHWHKSGCPLCTKIGFSKSQWVSHCNKKEINPILYIIKCWNDEEEFIKIGITSRTIKIRINNETKFKYNFEILKEIRSIPEFIYDEEKRLHKQFIDFRYKPLLEFAGSTECFSIKILNNLIDNII